MMEVGLRGIVNVFTERGIINVITERGIAPGSDSVQDNTGKYYVAHSLLFHLEEGKAASSEVHLSPQLHILFYLSIYLFIILFYL